MNRLIPKKVKHETKKWEGAEGSTDFAADARVLRNRANRGCADGFCPCRMAGHNVVPSRGCGFYGPCGH